MRQLLPINIPGRELGCENAILSGTSARHHVPDFEGCLSLKSVVHGAADWEADGRRFVVSRDCYLILNDRQHYTITIDSVQKATTFCLFFQRGFVEDIQRATIVGEEMLLDAPLPGNAQPLEFINRLEPQDSAVLGLLRRFHAAVASGEMTLVDWDQHFIRIAAQLTRERRDTARAIANLPAARASTRAEVYRRLLRGRDFLLASIAEPVRLNDIAAAACLSPFHFHRSFTQVFHQTPHQYLTRQRLHRAADLLRRTNLSVTEIGLDAGFESLASFSDLFRRHYGVSPRQYRGAI
jgi:AraC family transcriptional regulator